MLNNTTDPIRETVINFGRICRPGDEVDHRMATGEYRETLAKMLSRRGLKLENPAGDAHYAAGDWYVAATIAWQG